MLQRSQPVVTLHQEPAPSTSHQEPAPSTSHQEPVPSVSIESEFQQYLSGGSSTSSSQSSGGSVVFAREQEVKEFIELPFPRVVSTHAYCFLCKQRAVGLVRVPFHARMQIFKQKELYVPKENRCCPEHLIKDRLYTSDLVLLKKCSNTSLIESDEVKRFIFALAQNTDKSLFDAVGDLSLPERQLKAFTGLGWESIEKLSRMLTSMRNTSIRTVTQALVVFLFKMRTGNSNHIIASTMGLPNDQDISNMCASVINSFETDILPIKFGVDANSRDFLITEHTSGVAQHLHNIGDRLALICDGTYLRHEKSTNNEYQRKSYSGQKKAPLCKPFTISTTDGLVVDVPGPFLGTLNDAAIMKMVLEDPNGITKLLQPGDIFFLDRGFRDVVPYLEDLGYEVLMPALKGKRSQLTTAESNHSRFVYKSYYAVSACT